MTFKALVVFGLSVALRTDLWLCRPTCFETSRFHSQDRLHSRFIVMGKLHYKNDGLKLIHEIGILRMYHSLYVADFILAPVYNSGSKKASYINGFRRRYIHVLAVDKVSEQS